MGSNQYVTIHPWFGEIPHPHLEALWLYGKPGFVRKVNGSLKRKLTLWPALPNEGFVRTLKYVYCRSNSVQKGQNEPGTILIDSNTPLPELDPRLRSGREGSLIHCRD
jgi:hypothetical protein